MAQRSCGSYKKHHDASGLPLGELDESLDLNPRRRALFALAVHQLQGARSHGRLQAALRVAGALEAAAHRGRPRLR